MSSNSRFQVHLLSLCGPCVDSRPDYPLRRGVAGSAGLRPVLSEQKRSAPPWLRRRDRPACKQQAVEKPAAACLDTSASDVAQGKVQLV